MPQPPARLADAPASPLEDAVHAPDHVVLVADDGTVLGTTDRVGVHHERTPLHLAFSLYVVDPDDRLLLTRRALGKRTWAGVWTNTCCGHPRLDEPLHDAVRRRTQQELGLAVGDVRTALPDFRYTARDASGVVENELCPVHVAVVDEGAELSPDPDEVVEWRWVPWADVHAATRLVPQVFSPWMVLQMDALGDAPRRTARP